MKRAKSLLVRLLRLGGTAGGGGLTSRDRMETPLGGKAGGSFGGLLPFILCGKIGELVANCDAVTALVLSVPVLLVVMVGVLLPFCTVVIESES